MAPSKRPTWKTASGLELESAAVANELEYVIDRCAAVYAWRRDWVPPKQHRGTDELIAWLRAALSTPYSIIGPRTLSQIVVIDGLKVGGGSLTDSKLGLLERLARTAKGRSFLNGYLSSLTDLSPVFYVGETNNLVRRVREHLQGLTTFAETLSSTLKLTWTDMRLYYFNVGNESDDAEDASTPGKSLRTLLELVATRAAGAGSVKRPG